jgi:hypothetical protein
MMKKSKLKRRLLNRLAKSTLAIVSGAFVLSAPTQALALEPTELVETAEAVANTQVSKEIVSSALKVMRSRPALSLATSIVCISCAPVVGTATSASLCIACGILIAKTIG